MPRAADIQDGLPAIANQATGVAVAWHILIASGPRHASGRKNLRRVVASYRD